MWRILVDQARGVKRLKRGRGFEHISIGHVELPARSAFRTFWSWTMHCIVWRCWMVEYEETAAALEISPATLHRDLKLARAWLLHELRDQDRA
jgi:hypothetical protein